MPTALITGATEGIGRAICFTLGKAGHKIAACARTPSRLRALKDGLEEAGITVAVHPADVGIEADVKTAVSVLVKELGTIDVLVNNAGVALLKPFEELTVEDWDTTMATNLRSLYLMTREVLPAMRAGKQGAIVNIASLAGRNGFVGGSAYTASKHAVLGFRKIADAGGTEGQRSGHHDLPRLGRYLAHPIPGDAVAQHRPHSPARRHSRHGPGGPGPAAARAGVGAGCAADESVVWSLESLVESPESAVMIPLDPIDSRL